MLPLLERVVDHVERVQRVAAKEVRDRAVPLDHDELEAFAAELAEAVPEHPAFAVGWPQKEDYLRAFVDEVNWRLIDGSAARRTQAERTSAIKYALEAAICPQRPVHEAPWDQGFVDTLVRAAHARTGPPQYDGVRAPLYCDRLGLVRRAQDAILVGASGTVLLRLRGRDRLRWLLALESVLASSAIDPWCIDIEAIHRLSTHTRWDEYPGDDDWPANANAIARWAEFGALKHEEPPENSTRSF